MSTIRKCPHCKSKKGFITVTALKGYQYDSYDFTGKLLDSDRQGTDDTENIVRCLDCDKSISIKMVKIKGV